MSLTFPYPSLAVKSRRTGQGCKSCVHKLYCPAMYWLRRYGIEGRTIDDNNGIRCDSWSNALTDVIKTLPTQDDLDAEFYIAVHGIGSEPDRCGLTVESNS